MLRLGIVDFDSSHSLEFTRRYNHVGVDRDQWVDGAQVVAGWPGSSLMAPERIAEFEPGIRACGVEIVDSPSGLLEKVDAVLILSLAGSAHLERARIFLEAGMPTYVDKPFACSLEDAQAIVALAETHKAALFSSSAMRFSSDVVSSIALMSNNGNAIHSAMVYGPAKQEQGNPGFFHYGIHPVEMLFTLLGDECHSVTVQSDDFGTTLHGVWSGGRSGIVHGLEQGATNYGFVVFGSQNIVHRDVSTRYAYRNLCQAIVESFTSSHPAVPTSTTLQIVRFILAANCSRAEQRTVELANLPSSSTAG